MLQRIQTVYWLVSATLMAACIFLPLFEFNESGSIMIIYSKDVNFIYAPLIGQIVLTLIAIFLFNSRSLQIVTGYLIVVNILAVCFGVFVKYKILLEPHPELKITPWVFIFLLPIIFQILAIRAVKKDEALVKSMDRLR